MASPKETKALLASMTAEQKMVNMQALTYIKTLAASSNVNIYDWNLLSVFAKEDGINLVTDKKAINKLFFDHLEKTKKEAKEAKKTESAEDLQNAALEVEKIKAAFIDAAKSVRQAEIQTLKGLVWSQEDAVNRSNTALIEAIRVYNANLSKINALEQVTDVDVKYLNALKGVQKVIDDGIWINPVYENGFLYLNTKTNIMLHDVNKAANLDLHIDFGQLAVRININNAMRFEVIPYKNNISVDGYYHPHITSSASICWGEAQTAAMKNIANLELEKALRLLHVILNSYNPGSPYKPMARFKLESTKLSRISDVLKHPDKRRKDKAEAIAVPPLAAPLPPLPAGGITGQATGGNNTQGVIGIGGGISATGTGIAPTGGTFTTNDINF